MKKSLLLCVIITLLYLSAKAQNTSSTIYDNAFRNYSAGNFDDAIRYYNEYINSNTTNDKAIYERGMCYESIRRFDDAIRDYNTAIGLKPFFSLYYICRGYIYIKTGIPQNALSDFTFAIQYDPSNPEAYWGRVNAYLDLDKYDFALRDINSAINLKTDNALYYYVRAVVYSKLNDTTKFYDDIEKIMYNYPSSFFSNYKSQTVILILDNIANNIDRLTYEIAQSPDNPILYFRRGFNFYVFKKFNLAIEDFSNAVKNTSDVNSRLSQLAVKLVDNCKNLSN